MLKKIWSGVALLAAGAMLGNAPLASAEDSWPDGPLTVVVPAAAGGNADLVTRIEARYLEEELGVPIKVMNVPGGATIPGVMAMLKEPADGRTWLRFASPTIISTPLVTQAPYDPLVDFDAVWLNTDASDAVFVSADSPIETFEQFVAAAKEKELVLGVNNIGAPPHLLSVDVEQKFDIAFKILEQKTHQGAVTGLLGGHSDAVIVQTAFSNLFPGELRPLVILDRKKSYHERDLPGVPTLTDLYPDMTVGSWIRSGWAAKAGTDPAILGKMIEAGKKVHANPKVIEEIQRLTDLDPIYGPDAVRESMKEGIAFYTPLLKRLGLIAAN